MLRFEMYADNLYTRPAVSYKVRTYLEDFIYNRILIPNKLVVNQKWNIVLGVYFVADETEIVMLPPNTFTDIAVKSYTVLVPLNRIVSSVDLVGQYVQCLLDVLYLFLSGNYKTFNTAILTEIQSEIDWERIRSYSYPAPFDEQKYVGDSPAIRTKYESGNI